jgi:hypothetical protein
MSRTISWDGPTPQGHPYEFLDFKPDLSPDQLATRRRQWLRAALDEGSAWMRDSKEIQSLPNDIIYLMGDQWPTRRPSYKASPVNNRLLRSMEQTVAVLTDLRPVYEVKSQDDLFDDQSELLTNITKAWWVKNDVDFQLAMAVIYAYLTTGYLRIAWNKLLCGGRGDFQLYPLSPYDLIPIGPAHNFQDWEGCIYESVRNVAWFRRNFPGPGSYVQPDDALSRYAKPFQRPRQAGALNFDMLSPQMQRWVGSPREYGESSVAQAWYREYWIKDFSLNTSTNVIKMGTPGTNWYYEVRPGGPLYPRGRLIITGGADLYPLYDGPNFFWHGKFPFVALRLKPLPWQFHGASELRAKIPLQDIINTILAGTLDMIKKAVNPPLLFPDTAFSDAVKNALDPNMPNAKIAYNPMGSPPQWQNPPVLPSYVQGTAMYAQNEMDDDSGLLDVAGLARKKVTPAGDTLQGLKETQQTIMRLRGRYMEMAVRDIGQQMVPNFFQFYTLSRRMWMFGRAGVTSQDVFDANTSTMIPAGRKAQDHVLNFSFEIGSGSLLNVNQQNNQMLAIALRRNGDMSRKTLYKELDMENLYDNVKKELDEEQNEQAQKLLAAQAASGGAPPPGVASPGGLPAHKGKGTDNPMALLTAR